MPKTVITATNVRKEFNGLAAANGVEYSLEEYTTAGIIGPNGAGKSTFFNLLTGLYIPDGGTIKFFDRDITKMPAYDRVHLGLVRTFQLVSVFDTLTVLENMVLARVRFDKGLKKGSRFFLHNMLKSNQTDECLRALKKIDLEDKASVQVSDLSYGKKRELEIAIALSMNPVVLLLDEPLAGLSMFEIGEIIEIIKELKGTLTIVIVEHKISQILDVVERLDVMHEGKIICHGEPNTVICDPAVKECYFGKSDPVCY
jgi:branched-chain amino acid transport system ATP-binding protein